MIVNVIMVSTFVSVSTISDLFGVFWCILNKIKDNMRYQGFNVHLIAGRSQLNLARNIKI